MKQKYDIDELYVATVVPVSVVNLLAEPVLA